MITDAQLVNLALGDEAGWEELHNLCLDRPVAERLARALERETNATVYHAMVWAGVLRQMHAGLSVTLPPHRP